VMRVTDIITSKELRAVMCEDVTRPPMNFDKEDAEITKVYISVIRDFLSNDVSHGSGMLRMLCYIDRHLRAKRPQA
jgi:hypothetical protein